MEKGAASVSACATHAVLSGPGRQPDRGIVFEGSGFYEFDSALGRGEKVEPDQIVVGREVVGGGHPIDTRRDFGECVVCLGMNDERDKTEFYRVHRVHRG